MNLIGPIEFVAGELIFYFVLSPSSGSICWLNLLAIGDLEWDWEWYELFYKSLSFYIPYLNFLKGGTIFYDF